MLVLASVVLSLDPDPNPPAPARPPAPEARQGNSNRPAAASTTSSQPHSFGFADVRHLAQERARHEYHPVSAALPASLANLSSDQYRDIRTRRAKADVAILVGAEIGECAVARPGHVRGAVFPSRLSQP